MFHFVPLVVDIVIFLTWLLNIAPAATEEIWKRGLAPQHTEEEEIIKPIVQKIAISCIDSSFSAEHHSIQLASTTRNLSDHFYLRVSETRKIIGYC